MGGRIEFLHVRVAGGAVGVLRSTLFQGDPVEAPVWIQKLAQVKLALAFQSSLLQLLCTCKSPLVNVGTPTTLSRFP